MKCPKCKVQMSKREFESGLCPVCGWERRKVRTVRRVQVTITTVTKNTVEKSVPGCPVPVKVRTYQPTSGMRWSTNQQLSFSKVQERIQAIEAEISEWVELRGLAENDEEWMDIGAEISSLQAAKETVIRNSPEYYNWLRMGQPVDENGHTD